MLTTFLFALSCLQLPSRTYAQASNPITPITVEANSMFDEPGASTSSVTCASNLERMNATTFGGIQRWPFIGGTPAIAVDGDNSPTCASCWNVTYRNNFALIVAVTHEDANFQISRSAFNALTNETDIESSSVPAEAQLVDNRFCGLSVGGSRLLHVSLH